jgi:hypothetical protein
MTATQPLKLYPANGEGAPIRIDFDIPPPRDVQYYRDVLNSMEVGQSFEIPAYARDIVRRAAKDLNCKIQTATYNRKPRVWLASLPTRHQAVDRFLSILKRWSKLIAGDLWEGSAVDLLRHITLPEAASFSARTTGKLLTQLSRSDGGVEITRLDVKRGHRYRLNLAMLKSQ